MSFRTARVGSTAAVITAALGAAILGTPTRAAAEVGGNIDLDSFRPAIDSRGYLTINASQVLGHKDVSFGLGALSFGHNMLNLDGDGATYSIDNVITATLIAAFGIKAGPLELELGASIPLKILNGDRGPDITGDPNPNNNKDFKLSGQGLGNIGLHLKTRFLKTSRSPHIGLGVIASVFLPSTNPKDSFLGEGKAVPQIIGILDKEFGRQGRLRIALNGGIRIRSTTTFTNDGTNEMPTPPVTNKSITVGTEVPYGLGIAYAISRQKFDLVGEVFGTVPLGDHENYQPLEAIAGIKLYLARNSFLSLGAGRGLLPGKGANPDLRGFIGIVFEPNIGDRDGDGYKDDVDSCPDEPEDFDGFEDEDGCPEPDNDHDGILDDDDKCPNVPEDKDGFQDEDGCPEGDKNDRDGDGILDNVDKCPDDPEDFDQFQDEDGCPDPDNDQDGILDVDDLCPNDPEDKDGFEDEDGCPDLDNDKDRILDKDDKCPNEPETYNGTDDEDGCPDRGRVVVTDTAIEILDMVYFEYNKAIIKPQSYPILDAVAATMQGNPSIQLIEVQGHTDERGDDAYNLDLSDKRAHSVEKYLADKGVDSKRLSAQGYGETQPVDQRHGEAAWAKNRRVAFLILKRASD
ncbi:MAG: OmpA/MotB domain protein [Deltaproteobacteria bacterium]|nr:OmpA/MotB domain protein [Deltaproteobacteria bacterium]